MILMLISLFCATFFPVWADYYHIPSTPPYLTLWALWLFLSIIGFVWSVFKE